MVIKFNNFNFLTSLVNNLRPFRPSYDYCEPVVYVEAVAELESVDTPIKEPRTSHVRDFDKALLQL